MLRHYLKGDWISGFERKLWSLSAPRKVIRSAFSLRRSSKRDPGVADQHATS